MSDEPRDRQFGLEARLGGAVDFQSAFEQVLGAAEVEIWYLDRALRIVGGNEHAQELFRRVTGRFLDEPADASVFDPATGWANPARRRQECLEVVREGRPLLGSIESRREQGEVRTLSVDKVPLTDPGGAVQGLLLVVTDLTRRDRSHEALHESKERYRSLTKNLPGTVYLCRNDERWSMLYLGAQVAELTGYPREDFIGDRISFVDLYHPDDADAIWPTVERALEARAPFQLVYRLRHREDGWRWVEERGTGVFRQGELIYLQGFLYDISARKEAEAERERLIVELEQKNAELERFSYTVSHELKRPLVTIQGFVGLLQQDLSESRVSEVSEHLQQIAGAAEGMGQLLQELLELSRAGRMMGETTEVSLDDLTESALERVAGELRGKPLDLRVEPGAPALFGDRSRLIEVMQNLIENAIKYTPGSDSVKICISAEEKEGQVVVAIRDWGLGIAQQHLGKVFGLFNQLDPEHRGSGVGLAIVRRIVELHDGRIWVESEGLGLGSTFLFSLPAAKPEGLGDRV